MKKVDPKLDSKLASAVTQAYKGDRVKTKVELKNLHPLIFIKIFLLKI